MGHRLRPFDKSGVVVVHTIDVGPNLNLRRIDGRTDERCRVVRTATLQVVHFAIGVAADEALCDIDVATLVLLQLHAQFLADVLEVRLAVLVGTHKVERGKETGVVALFDEIVRHHCRRDDFTLSDDDFLLEHREDALRERAQVVELLLDEVECLTLHVVRRVEFVHVATVFGLQGVDGLVGPFRILLVEIVGNLDQRVGRARHCRKHDEILFAVRNESNDVLHALRCAYRRTAEFHYFHICVVLFLVRFRGISKCLEISRQVLSVVTPSAWRIFSKRLACRMIYSLSSSGSNAS